MNTKMNVFRESQKNLYNDVEKISTFFPSSAHMFFAESIVQGDK